MPWSLPLVLAALVAAPSAPQEKDPVVPQREVNAAIDRGVRWLLDEQLPDGSWVTERPGRTALAVYALLKSGVDPERPAVRRALRFLAVHDIDQTYDVAIMAQVLATLDDPTYLEWLDVLAERLESFQLDTGDWSYPNGGGDLSNTQYAALGLWSAGKGGIAVPVETWERLFDGVQRYDARRGEFGYSRGGSGARPSMTAAGVATLHICAWGLGKDGALSAKVTRLVEHASEKGVEALAKEADSVLSATSGDWPYYRLYAVERVGALAGVPRLGEHDWYQVGAADLLKVQNEDGSWGFRHPEDGRRGFDRRRGDPWMDVRTDFALLFLRRATSFTGLSESSHRTVFGTTSADDAVQVRGTGGDPLTLFVTGWSPAVRERYEWPHQKGDGPHVSRVEYLVDGQVAEVAEADPARPAGIERFAVQHTFQRGGKHVVVARATLHAPPADGSREPGGAFVIASPSFEVEIAGIVPAWMREAVADRHRNLMAAGQPSVRASSALRQQGIDYAPENAVDNFTQTAWLARAEDEAPHLTITLAKAQQIDVILLSSPRTVPYREGHFARPMEVEVVLDEGQPQRVLMPPDERRKARLELDKPVHVRQIDLILRWKAQGVVESTGLAEVELQRR